MATESRNLGRNHIVTLTDSFGVSSTQGRHLCLVHEAMGLFPKVNNLGLPVPFVKVVARQLLMALDFLHRECHVVHTGAPLSRIVRVMSELSIIEKDLKPDNIPVKLDNVETAILIREEELPPIASVHRSRPSFPVMLSCLILSAFLTQMSFSI